jgi:hypothetical protein
MKRIGSFYSVRTMSLMVMIGLSLMWWPGSRTVARVTPSLQAVPPVTAGVSHRLAEDFTCLYVISRDYPACRGKIGWLISRPWLASRLQSALSRWRRVLSLCLPVIRRVS